MIEIARASLEDAAILLELQKLAYESEARLYNDFEMPPLLQTVEEMRAEFLDKIVLKAEIEGRIVGSVRASQQSETCLVRRLFVHPDFQRRGIASALMQRIEVYFASATRFELFTGYKSAGNIRLYERLGYTIFKRETAGEGLAFVFMEKFR